MRVFSGIQPTGNLHLGNYLGAIVKFVSLQETSEDPDVLKSNIRQITAGFIASGINYKEHIIFNQSKVPFHSEMAWILNCVARVGWLNRMTQFKDKAGTHTENASVGLYTYPILMAADILAYNATHVPVGEDQKQHIELARDIAKKFNMDFSKTIVKNGYKKDFFNIPEPLINGPVPRVMSLKDASKKMSSNDPSDLSRINLIDNEDSIQVKIRKAKTDPDSLPSEPLGLENRNELRNLIDIYAGLCSSDRDSVLQSFGGMQFSGFKKELTDLLIAKICPIGKEMKRLMNDVDAIDKILGDGADRASTISKPILEETKKIIGF
jgi:tryptophanyl-tRNA synthetase